MSTPRSRRSSVEDPTADVDELDAASTPIEGDGAPPAVEQPTIEQMDDRTDTTQTPNGEGEESAVSAAETSAAEAAQRESALAGQYDPEPQSSDDTKD